MSTYTETKFDLAMERISADPKGLKFVLEEATLSLVLNALDHQVSSYEISNLYLALSLAWLSLSFWRFVTLGSPGRVHTDMYGLHIHGGVNAAVSMRQYCVYLSEALWQIDLWVCLLDICAVLRENVSLLGIS
jgi:hypothetical protein